MAFTENTFQAVVYPKFMLHIKSANQGDDTTHWRSINQLRNTNLNHQKKGGVTTHDINKIKKKRSLRNNSASN